MNTNQNKQNLGANQQQSRQGQQGSEVKPQAQKTDKDSKGSSSYGSSSDKR